MCDNDCQVHQQTSEEAHYWWTINEFQELVKTYGARKVFGDMGTEYIIQITKELSDRE
jgi:hypothetical protein